MLGSLRAAALIRALDGFAFPTKEIFMEEEQKTKTFSFAISGERALPEILHMLLQLRASVDALVVLTCETLGQVSQTSPKEIAQRYEKMKEDFVLNHSFLCKRMLGQIVRKVGISLELAP
jgi:hypothetical protein